MLPPVVILISYITLYKYSPSYQNTKCPIADRKKYQLKNVSFALSWLCFFFFNYNTSAYVELILSNNNGTASKLNAKNIDARQTKQELEKEKKNFFLVTSLRKASSFSSAVQSTHKLTNASVPPVASISVFFPTAIAHTCTNLGNIYHTALVRYSTSIGQPTSSAFVFLFKS